MMVLRFSLTIHMVAAWIHPWVFINQPADFFGSLRDVVHADRCLGVYSVDPNLYGTLTSEGEYLDSRGVNFASAQGRGVDVAWVVGHRDLEEILNRKCCAADVRNFAQCFCKIAKAVGLRSQEPGLPDELDYLDYTRHPSYVIIPSTHGVTNTTSQNNEFDVISPTFANMVSLMPSTFPRVFASLPAASRPKCTPNTAELVPLLEAGVELGPPPDSWSSLANSPHHNDIMAELGATASTFSGVDRVTVESLASIGDRLCTDVMAVRTYLWFAFDASPLNLGTGVTSGGSFEYVTSPNPQIKFLGGFDRLTWGGQWDDKFCSGPHARASGQRRLGGDGYDQPTKPDQLVTV